MPLERADVGCPSPIYLEDIVDKATESTEIINCFVYVTLWLKKSPSR